MCMFTLLIEAIAGLSRSLLEVLNRVGRPQPAPAVVVDPIRLWSVQQEHYWDRTDW